MEGRMKNVGTRDSQVRWLAGSALFVYSFFLGGVAHWLLLTLGAVLVGTAYFHYCPIWFGLRLNTHSTVKKRLG